MVYTLPGVSSTTIGAFGKVPVPVFVLKPVVLVPKLPLPNTVLPFVSLDIVTPVASVVESSENIICVEGLVLPPAVKNLLVPNGITISFV